MAKTVVLQDRFERGMIRDMPIDGLPKGAVWDLVDMIPNHDGAGLTTRGGWGRHSATLGGGTTAAALTVAPFATGPQLVAINSSGAVKQVALDVGTVTARGTAQVPFQQPTFYRDRVYIPSDNGTTTVKYYDGTNNAAAVSGSPPAGMMAVAWKDHLVLARNAANPNRLWFSNGGDPTTWDTAADGQWLDLTWVPNGLAVLRGMILSFSEYAIERVRGDIIPGVAGSDLVREHMLNIGCPDPAAIATTDDYIVFANADGVFLTDGIGLVDLTEQCGIKTYYTDTTYGQINNLTGGIWRGHYILSVYAGTTFINAFVFDIARRRAWRLTNLKAAMMATAPTNAVGSTSGELFFAELSDPYISRLSWMWIQSDQGSADGNSTRAAPAVRTGHFRGTQGRKRWRRLYVTHTLEQGVTPGTVGWNFDTTLTAATVTATLPVTTDAESVTPRSQIPITGSKHADGLSVYLAGGTGATDFRVFSIEAEVHPIEQSR